ncbi:hypothetical protein Sste5346_008702 [Sporothrix stenoceras]|uniref:Uncharacterized protein n=1 Tax=Sporothrix stenoceras TaxID=5173 RepID=A0ABR3YMZ1_9PEZI
MGHTEESHVNAIDVETEVSLAGKIIAVTGANRGIGLGIAECALDNGAAKVYSIDVRSPGTDSDDEFVVMPNKYLGRLFSVVAEVTKQASITAAIDRIVNAAGAIHGHRRRWFERVRR